MVKHTIYYSHNKPIGEYFMEKTAKNNKVKRVV